MVLNGTIIKSLVIILKCPSLYLLWAQLLEIIFFTFLKKVEIVSEKFEVFPHLKSEHLFWDVPEKIDILVPHKIANTACVQEMIKEGAVQP